MILGYKREMKWWCFGYIDELILIPLWNHVHKLVLLSSMVRQITDIVLVADIEWGLFCARL